MMMDEFHPFMMMLAMMMVMMLRMSSLTSLPFFINEFQEERP